MKSIKRVLVLLLLQTLSLPAFAKSNFVDSDAVTELGLSFDIESGSAESHCESYGNFLYQGLQETAVFNFFTPQFQAYDQGGSNYTETRRYCSYKVTIKHNSNWKVRFKNPYFKIQARAVLSETVGAPTPTAKMDFSFDVKAAVNSQVILDNIMVGSSAFGEAKLKPIQGTPLKSPWTECGSTQIEIQLEMEAHAERLSGGNGTALAVFDRAQFEMEWMKCPEL